MRFTLFIPWLRFLLGCSVLPLLSRSESIVLPYSRSYISPSGEWSVEITPVRLKDRISYNRFAEGIFLAISHEETTARQDLVAWMSCRRAGKLHWERPLESIIAPRDAFISDQGDVLLMGDWFAGANANDRAFSLYGFHGDLVCAYSMGDLFDAKKRWLLAESGSSTWWSDIKIEAYKTIGRETNGDDPFSKLNIDLHAFKISLRKDLRDSGHFPSHILLSMDGHISLGDYNRRGFKMKRIK